MEKTYTSKVDWKGGLFLSGGAHGIIPRGMGSPQ